MYTFNPGTCRQRRRQVDLCVVETSMSVLIRVDATGFIEGARFMAQEGQAGPELRTGRWWVEVSKRSRNSFWMTYRCSDVGTVGRKVGEGPRGQELRGLPQA